MTTEELLKQSLESLREMIAQTSPAPWTIEPHANGLDRLIMAANGHYVAHVYTPANAEVIADTRNNILGLIRNLERLIDLVDSQYRKLERYADENAYLRRQATGQSMENWHRYETMQQERDSARNMGRYAGIGLAAILSALDNDAIPEAERISRARQYVALMSIHLESGA